MMFKSIKPAIFGCAAATFIGAAAFTASFPAAAQDPAGPHRHKAARGAEASIEDHIAGLKTRLKITEGEEAQWDAVADVMRENAKSEQTRRDERGANANATAIDDLKNYAAMAQSHADGVKKLEAAFEALYNAMPDDQKKTADEVFAEHEGRGGHGHGHGKKTTG
jgi:hypothetical protein